VWRHIDGIMEGDGNGGGVQSRDGDRGSGAGNRVSLYTVVDSVMSSCILEAQAIVPPVYLTLSQNLIKMYPVIALKKAMGIFPNICILEIDRESMYRPLNTVKLY
jgi:hypothetical protein